MIQAFRKSHKALAQEILSGINSSPIKETHLLSVEIKERQLKRFFMRLLGKNDKDLPLKINAKYVRVQEDVKGVSAKHYVYSDTFASAELDELKNGKDLLKKENSFISNLTKWINKNIGE